MLMNWGYWVLPHSITEVVLNTEIGKKSVQGHYYPLLCAINLGDCPHRFQQQPRALFSTEGLNQTVGWGTPDT